MLCHQLWMNLRFLRQNTTSAFSHDVDLVQVESTFIGSFTTVVCGKGPFGGGGNPFSDASYAGERITRIDVRSGDRVDGLVTRN